MLARKGFIWLRFPDHNQSLQEIRTDIQAGLEHEGGADAEAMEGIAYRLPCPGLLSLSSYRTQDDHTRDGTTQAGLVVTELVSVCSMFLTCCV